MVLAVALVAGGVVTATLVVGLATTSQEQAQGVLLAPWTMAVLEGLMVVATWAFGVGRYRTGWRVLGLWPPGKRYHMALPWLALLASMLFTVAYAAVVRGLGLDFLLPPQVPTELLGEGFRLALNYLVIGLWGPVAEEVFFRGFVLQALLARWPAPAAAAASAALFAASHVEPGTLLPIFVTGLLLAWLYIKSRSLWPPIVAHAAQNVLALALVP